MNKRGRRKELLKKEAEMKKMEQLSKEIDRYDDRCINTISHLLILTNIFWIIYICETAYLILCKKLPKRKKRSRNGTLEGLWQSKRDLNNVHHV